MNKEIVLITGTNSGFGLLATIELAKNSFFVIATMRDLNKKSRLLENARNLHLEENIVIFALDVNNPRQIQSITNEITQKYGAVDILINNAGYCLGGMSELVEIEDWRHQFETNFFGAVALTQAVLPSMRSMRRGKIVNIGSISGKIHRVVC